MKKLLLVFAMPLMLSGCFEKEPEVQPAAKVVEDMDSKLQGTWIKSGMKIVKNNGAIQTINDENGEKLIFSAGNATFIENDGTQSSYIYQVSDSIIYFQTATRKIKRLDSSGLVLESDYDQNSVFLEEYKR